MNLLLSSYVAYKTRTGTQSSGSITNSKAIGIRNKSSMSLGYAKFPTLSARLSYQSSTPWL